MPVSFPAASATAKSQRSPRARPLTRADTATSSSPPRRDAATLSPDLEGEAAYPRETLRAGPEQQFPAILAAGIDQLPPADVGAPVPCKALSPHPLHTQYLWHWIKRWRALA